MGDQSRDDQSRVRPGAADETGSAKFHFATAPSPDPAPSPADPAPPPSEPQAPARGACLQSAPPPADDNARAPGSSVYPGAVLSAIAHPRILIAGLALQHVQARQAAGDGGMAQSEWDLLDAAAETLRLFITGDLELPFALSVPSIPIPEVRR